MTEAKLKRMRYSRTANGRTGGEQELPRIASLLLYSSEAAIDFKTEYTAFYSLAAFRNATANVPIERRLQD